jgi:hypothetical protein
MKLQHINLLKPLYTKPESKKYQVKCLGSLSLYYPAG